MKYICNLDFCEDCGDCMYCYGDDKCHVSKDEKHWCVPKEAQAEASEAAQPGGAGIDEIISALYRRFKDWSKRGFGPEDVTWCEVKADILKLIEIHSASPAQKEKA